MTAHRYPAGTRVRDRDSGREGILVGYMDPGDPFDAEPDRRTGLRAYIRPANGIEFDADPAHLEIAFSR